MFNVTESLIAKFKFTPKVLNSCNSDVVLGHQLEQHPLLCPWVKREYQAQLCFLGMSHLVRERVLREEPWEGNLQTPAALSESPGSLWLGLLKQNS